MSSCKDCQHEFGFRHFKVRWRVSQKNPWEMLKQGGWKVKDTIELLEEICPLIHDRAILAFPEFGFERKRDGWEATRGEINGEKARGQLYYYDTTPECFKHLKTGKTIAVWDYVQNKYGLSQQETLVKLAEMADYELPE